VKVDTVYGNNNAQSIKMYWANPAATSQSSGSAVFTAGAGYKTVLHMNEPSGDVNDATVSGVVGTNTGTTTTAGIVGPARNFGGTNASNTASEDGRQMISLGAPEALNFTGLLTYSAWVRWLNIAPTEGTSSYRTALWRGSDGGGEVFVRIGTTQQPNNYFAGRWTGSSSLTTSSPGTAVATGDSATWIHLAGVYNGTNWSLYRNGTFVSSSADDPDGPQIPTTAWHIGRSGVGATLNSRWWSGDIDEVHIANQARSADYLKLTYESQKLSQKLTNIAAAITVPRAPTDLIASPNATIGVLVLSWAAPEDNGGSAIIGYNAYVVGDSAKSCTTTGALTCNLTNLPDGSYVVAVRAINAVGQSLPSPLSEPATPTGILGGLESRTFRVTGGDRPYSFRIPDGFVSTTERLSLSIHDTYGRTVWSQSIQPSKSQVREISWNGRATNGTKASVGMYVVRLRAEGAGTSLEAVQGSILK
jgi:hypothetical protein